ncbi:Hypothetical protein KNT65_gp123 [Escherichia phage EcS1]|uniref:Uncharacterized protein n=1 Tax=Escherichia phage EcS1 TaxID=2083276 RepID=A0A2Z5ZCK3_9CAUD|nr:Hypothetical protein KNT65_gp123 [Escherichia phage EcS1]BBC78171.1 Hypothetical protein [Escherichia phage EcS1]
MKEFFAVLKRFEDAARAAEEANCDSEISDMEWRTRETEADFQRQALIDFVQENFWTPPAGCEVGKL